MFRKKRKREREKRIEDFFREKGIRCRVIFTVWEVFFIFPTEKDFNLFCRELRKRGELWHRVCAVKSLCSQVSFLLNEAKEVENAVKEF